MEMNSFSLIYNILIIKSLKNIHFLQSSLVKLNGHWQKNLPVRSIQVADGGQEFSLQSIISSSQV